MLKPTDCLILTLIVALILHVLWTRRSYSRIMALHNSEVQQLEDEIRRVQASRRRIAIDFVQVLCYFRRPNLSLDQAVAQVFIVVLDTLSVVVKDDRLANPQSWHVDVDGFSQEFSRFFTSQMAFQDYYKLLRLARRLASKDLSSVIATFPEDAQNYFAHMEHEASELG